ncbi:oxidoreductase [Verrucomicrobiota bacterium]|nr:general stress protein 69 [Verrucomicrobiota bacterium]GDY18459.1 oxidoreductase [Verrucomicrobiota bacterium]
MKLRKLGRSDLHLTPVGLGTWAMGGGDWKFGWGPQDDAQSIRTIHEALDLGINWLDTAPVYGLGHCEDVVGRALQELKGRRPILSTKCERCWDEDRQIIPRLKRASIRREIEDSLRRLGVDAIDMYQIHWPQPDEDIEEGWSAIAELVQEGKVRWAGVSNFNVVQLKRLQPIHPVAFLQPPYSMLNRGIEAELIPYCEAHDIGIIPYSPMQKGLLSGKVTQAWVDALPVSDHRRADPQFNEPLLARNITLNGGLRTIASHLGTTPAELAIAWVLRQPRVTSAIVGARKPGQIAETIGGGRLTIPADALTEIERLLKG